MTEKIREVLKTLASVLMIVLTVVAIAAVIWRVAAKYISFIDGTTFYWANEFQLLMLHWVVVIGMAVVYMLDTDIRITLFFDKFHGGLKKNVRRCFHLIDICVFSVIVVFGGKLAIQEWHTPTSSLMWSRGLFIYSPYVLLGIFVVVFSTYQLIHSFIRTEKGGQ